MGRSEQKAPRSLKEHGMADNSRYSQMSDRELLENNAADSGKIAELISRYMKAVFAAAAKYSSAADHEELVSDGMQGLMAAIGSYDGSKGEFSTYLSVCLDNRLRNTAKRSLRRKNRLSGNDPEELDLIADTRPTPEEVVIDRESSEAVLENMRTNLTTLEFRCMDGLMMGLSYEEIAKLLDIDRKAVDNAVTRARAKLRSFYKDKL